MTSKVIKEMKQQEKIVKMAVICSCNKVNLSKAEQWKIQSVQMNRVYLFEHMNVAVSTADDVIDHHHKFALGGILLCSKKVFLMLFCLVYAAALSLWSLLTSSKFSL
jgi:hypothetical protein